MEFCRYGMTRLFSTIMTTATIVMYVINCFLGCFTSFMHFS